MRIGAGLGAHQHVEAVELCLQRDLQIGHAGLRLFQQSLGLGDLAIVGLAGVEANMHDLQEMRVGRDLIQRNGESGLRAADLQIGIGRIGGDGDPCRELVGFGRFGFFPRGPGGAAQAAREVDLPTRHRTEGVFLLVAMETRLLLEDRADRPMLADILPGRARVGIHGRKEIGLGPARRGAGLLDPGEGGGEIEILRECAAHHLLQRRIVEAGPPFVQLRRRALHLGTGSGDVVKWRQLGLGRLIVRPDLAAAQRGNNQKTGRRPTDAVRH